MAGLLDDGATIFAPASGAGRAAIMVVRISGPATGATLDQLCGGRPPARRASLRRLRAATGEVLDQALVLWMPGPASYTGEDTAELHLHAGRAVVAGVAAALVAQGCRPAEAGEFTRRAFLNGRLDLVEAEAVADLVAAETAAQRRQALRQLDGALSALVAEWAARLTRLLAFQEALIDFPDEDLPGGVDAGVVCELTSLRQAMAAHARSGEQAERLRDGLVFAIVGPPNVGKSSLINWLAARDVAIVSPHPGTTRDTLEARVVLGDVPVTLVDTAGLRDTRELVEAEGVRRARARAGEADLVVAVEAVGQVPATTPIAVESDRCLRVCNKVDLLTQGEEAPPGSIAVSVRTGDGLETLRSALGACAQALTRSQGPPPLTRARHRAAVTEAAARLAHAERAPLPELRAEDLRLALQALGRITGAVGVEDLLDVIFSQFCIGK